MLKKHIKIIKDLYPGQIRDREELNKLVVFLSSLNKTINDVKIEIRNDKKGCEVDFGNRCNMNYRNKGKSYSSIERFVMDQDDIDCNMNYSVGGIKGEEAILNKFISLLK